MRKMRLRMLKRKIKMYDDDTKHNKRNYLYCDY